MREGSGGLGKLLKRISPRGRQQAAPSDGDEPRGHSPADEAVCRFAGGVAHDLNNILLVIQGYAEMALEEPDAGPGVRGLMEEMRDATGRAAHLVRDLQVIGRRGPFSPRLVDLSDVVRRRMPALAAECPVGIELRPALTDAPCPVRADEDLLARMLDALCARARESMPDGGVITVRTEPPGPDEAHRASLHVLDTGIALTDGLQARLFEAYAPGPSGGKGQGLGMTVARAAAERLEGQILVHTGHGGTDVQVTFPQTAGRAFAVETVPKVEAEKPAAETRPARGGGATILLAEDDEGLRALAVKVLAREGYTVLAARDGQEAVDIFSRDRSRISLALLDDVMPRMGGRAAAARIQDAAPQLPIVLCSGYDWHLGAQGASGTCRTLQKPWQPRDLLRTVREGLERGR